MPVGAGIPAWMIQAYVGCPYCGVNYYQACQVRKPKRLPNEAHALTGGPRVSGVHQARRTAYVAARSGAILNDLVVDE